MPRGVTKGSDPIVTRAAPRPSAFERAAGEVAQAGVLAATTRRELAAKLNRAVSIGDLTEGERRLTLRCFDARGPCAAALTRTR